MAEFTSKDLELDEPRWWWRMIPGKVQRWQETRDAYRVRYAALERRIARERGLSPVTDFEYDAASALNLGALYAITASDRGATNESEFIDRSSVPPSPTAYYDGTSYTPSSYDSSSGSTSDGGSSSDSGSSGGE